MDESTLIAFGTFSWLFLILFSVVRGCIVGRPFGVIFCGIIYLIVALDCRGVAPAAIGKASPHPKPLLLWAAAVFPYLPIVAWGFDKIRVFRRSKHLSDKIEHTSWIAPSVEQLADQPESGSRLPELRRSRYRQIEPPCRVFYRYDGTSVFVLHALRGGMRFRKSRLRQRDQDR